MQQRERKATSVTYRSGCMTFVPPGRRAPSHAASVDAEPHVARKARESVCVSVAREQTPRRFGQQANERCFNIFVDCVDRSSLQVLCTSTQSTRNGIFSHSVSHDDTCGLREDRHGVGPLCRSTAEAIPTSQASKAIFAIWQVKVIF
jgi:hypothetical protein